MAHENLKFRFNKDNHTDFQPILGSQDYGTFYMVYIKINSYNNVVNEFGYEEHKYNCDFKIQNFIGDITIGFGNTIPFISFNSNINENDPVHAAINFSIAPFSTDTSITERELSLQQPLQRGMILHTNFKRDSPPSDLYNPLKPNDSKYINPYRFKRDGEDYIEISGRLFGTNDAFPIPDNLAAPTGFCVPNRLIID